MINMFLKIYERVNIRLTIFVLIIYWLDVDGFQKIMVTSCSNTVQYSAVQCSTVQYSTEQSIVNLHPGPIIHFTGVA